MRKTAIGLLAATSLLWAGASFAADFQNYSQPNAQTAPGKEDVSCRKLYHQGALYGKTICAKQAAWERARQRDTQQELIRTQLRSLMTHR